MKKVNTLLLSLVCLYSASASATSTNVVIQDIDAVAAAVEAKLAPIGAKIEAALKALYAEAAPFVETLSQNLLSNLENQIANSVEMNNLKTLLANVEANPSLANFAALISGGIADLEAEAKDLKSGFLAIHTAQQTVTSAATTSAAANTSKATAAAAVNTRAMNSAQFVAIQQIVNSTASTPAPAPASK